MAERKISFFKRGIIAGVGTSLVVIGGAYCVEANSSDSGEPLSQTEGFWIPENTVKPLKRTATPNATANVTLLNSPTSFDIQETPLITEAPLLVDPTKVPFVPTPPPIFVPQPTSAPTPEATQIPEGLNYEAARVVIDKINSARADNGLVLLVDNSSLAAAAQKYAQFLIVNRQSLDHCHDGSPQERGEREGYVGGVGEVLVAGDSPEIMFERLMNSPNHRAAILNPDIRDIGFGYYKGQFGSSGAGELGLPSINSWHTC